MTSVTVVSSHRCLACFRSSTVSSPLPATGRRNLLRSGANSFPLPSPPDAATRCGPTRTSSRFHHYRMPQLVAVPRELVRASITTGRRNSLRAATNSFAHPSPPDAATRCGPTRTRSRFHRHRTPQLVAVGRELVRASIATGRRNSLRVDANKFAHPSPPDAATCCGLPRAGSGFQPKTCPPPTSAESDNLTRR
jgi:hypothetical protein